MSGFRNSPEETGSDLKSRLKGYFGKAEKKFSTIKIVGAENDGKILVESAMNYFHDARHFMDEGDYVSALAALEYAEGFVDAGRKIGLLEAKHTGEL